MSRTSQIPQAPWSAVSARRMNRHRLTEPAPARDAATIADVAGAMCGAHAQVLAAGELSLALRLTDGTREDVQRALWTDRTLVKTYGPRGTAHLLPTEELPLWTGALDSLADVIGAGIGGPKLLTPEQIDQLTDAFGVILADTELTVDELTEALVDHVGPWVGERVMEAFQDLWPRWRWATHLLAYRGALCFGPNKGRKVTYTSPLRWAPHLTPTPPEEAGREIARRYLRGYGPATSQEFARWLSAPKKWAADVLFVRPQTGLRA